MSNNNHISEQTINILRHLAHGGKTTGELVETFGKVPTTSAVYTLAKHCFIESEQLGRTSLHTITRKGLKYIEPKDGPIALPRMAVSADTYKGERTITTRPGAMDAYHRPSRRGEQYVPHARPISLASRVQDSKFR